MASDENCIKVNEQKQLGNFHFICPGVIFERTITMNQEHIVLLVKNVNNI